MSCKYYERFGIGAFSEQDFRNHLRTCDTCRNNFEQDARLLRLSSSLRTPVDENNLWKKIEENLSNEQQNRKRSNFQFTDYKTAFLRIAAVLILGVTLGFYLLLNDDLPEKGILEADALKKVNQTEQDYVQAIDHLELLAQAEMTELDLNRQLLYRDKLETIDRQIFSCYEALEQNPANAHIRRYLFMALLDKKETLKEIISTKPEKSDS